MVIQLMRKIAGSLTLWAAILALVTEMLLCLAFVFRNSRGMWESVWRLIFPISTHQLIDLLVGFGAPLVVALIALIANTIVRNQK